VLFISPKSCRMLWLRKVSAQFFMIKAQFFAGCRILWLPPYCPEYNPIEESFNTGDLSFICVPSVFSYGVLQ